jgi:transcription initiation factor TFIIIB Brf1 subunit/transcription initiation factor TFIIB
MDLYKCDYCGQQINPEDYARYIPIICEYCGLGDLYELGDPRLNERKDEDEQTKD